MSSPFKQIDMQSNDSEDNDDSSDYGSEFTPDEEELLNELLARVAPERQIPTTTTTTATALATTTTTTSEPQQQSLTEVLLHDLQPLSDPLIISDIEDYEVPHSARVPRVLGREAWSPATNRVWQQKQQKQQQTGGTARKLWSSQPPVSSSSISVDIRAQIGGMFLRFSNVWVFGVG
jgi:exonuclease V